jgi:hypothetical protein
MQPNEIIEVLSRPISQELPARDVTRRAYVAKDGTPAQRQERETPVVVCLLLPERIRNLAGTGHGSVSRACAGIGSIGGVSTWPPSRTGS